MTKKQARQAAILDLVAEHVVGSQEELRQLLLGARDGRHSGDTVA